MSDTAGLSKYLHSGWQGRSKAKGVQEEDSFDKTSLVYHWILFSSKFYFFNLASPETE